MIFNRSYPMGSILSSAPVMNARLGAKNKVGMNQKDGFAQNVILAYDSNFLLFRRKLDA